MTRSVELSALDLRYESYRMRNPAVEARLLASIAERGIEEALEGVDAAGGSILLNGFKRYRCASKLRIQVFARFAYLGALISSATFVTFGYFVGRHVPWGYSRIALIAIAGGVVFTASGLPLRIALRIKNMAATAIANRANRPTEASTQLACEPRK